MDLKLWREKVRTGGLLAGHDLFNLGFEGVLEALLEDVGGLRLLPSLRLYRCCPVGVFPGALAGSCYGFLWESLGRPLLDPFEGPAWHGLNKKD